ncbi:MAG TPA: bifunctional molybdenum cofactor biosynthesis protein MoaC/MoaB [bacterium]|nr:bifunctional molybdenum cofactor biosynthesis protein MoaC/MoaB [bacterium]
MIDITNKIESLRTAVAESRVIAKKETIDRAVKGDTPKGDVLNVARAAACLAAKKTQELIPYCHPLAIDAVSIAFEPKPGEITVRAEVKTVAKTGVEMEALTAAVVAALTIYDMMKGYDKDVVIGETRLIEKHGGKSDFGADLVAPVKTAVLVTSDSVSGGKKSDKSGKMICDEMKRFPVDVKHYAVVPDDREEIRKKILGWIEEKIGLIVTTGGTGLGPRDVTVEVVSSLIEREAPGITEAMRAFGQRRTPYAMLSRGVAGTRGRTLIVTLPGSSNGVREGIAAVFPHVLHAFNMMGGGGH